jgi:tetratricopeptide (TPR) repeat protein
VSNVPTFNLQKCQRLLAYLLSFHAIPNSFAYAKSATRFFSSKSELFAQNTRGWGWVASLCGPSAPQRYLFRHCSFADHYSRGPHQAENPLPEAESKTKMRPIPPYGGCHAEVAMRKMRILLVVLFSLFCSGSLSAQQIGKYVPIQAGSEVDHALTAINAATDPAQKLALIDQFAAGPGKEGNYPIMADGLYVDYYLAQKNYDKAFEYGDKLFALDADNFQNAMNMIRAASEKGDADRLISYGEKTQGVLQRYNSSPPPAGTDAKLWEQQKAQTLESNKDSITYIQQAVFSGAYQVKDVAKRAALLARFAQIFPDSAYANQALGVAAAAYQQAQNAPKMLEVANGLLAKDPNNLGMLLLLSDYYSEKGEQLDKAEAYAKKAVSLLDAAQKPEGATDEQWAQQKALQKGLALSSLGQVNIEKKDNVQAVTNLKAAARLLKSDDGSYARNQYRLGFALLNLKRNPEAKEAFTQAASVNSPYKALAQDKLKAMSGAGPARRKPS